jgi:hypothetical protein
MYKIYHPKADRDRLYVKKKEGIGGLLQNEVTYKTDTINIAGYLNTKYTKYQFLNTVNSHERNQSNTNSPIRVVAKVAAELNQ